MDGVVRSYCVRSLGDTLHAREFPPILFTERPLHVRVPVSGALFLVPDHPWSSIVLSTIGNRIVVHHDGLFDLNLHTQVAGVRIISVLRTVELGPHGMGDISRSGELMSDDNPLASTLLSGIYKCEGQMINRQLIVFSIP